MTPINTTCTPWRVLRSRSVPSPRFFCIYKSPTAAITQFNRIQLGNKGSLFHTSRFFTRTAITMSTVSSSSLPTSPPPHKLTQRSGGLRLPPHTILRSFQLTNPVDTSGPRRSSAILSRASRIPSFPPKSTATTLSPPPPPVPGFEKLMDAVRLLCLSLGPPHADCAEAQGP